MADRNENLGNGGSSSRPDNRELNDESGLDRKTGGMSGSGSDRSSTDKSGDSGLGGSTSRPDRSGTSGDDLSRNREGGMGGSSSDRSESGSQKPADERDSGLGSNR